MFATSSFKIAFLIRKIATPPRSFISEADFAVADAATATGLIITLANAEGVGQAFRPPDE
jgi:hypothetical protein